MKLRKLIRFQLTVAAVIVGLGITAIVNATRNGSGTYSLPAGNPVVSGTTISSTTHNNTMSDVATELTDSLSRTGKGGMLAALKGVGGSVSAPAFSFSSDPDTGWYSIGANEVGLSCGGTKVLDATSTRITLPYGLDVTQAVTDTYGLQATGNGSEFGARITGGATGGGLRVSAGATGPGSGIFSQGIGALGYGIDANGGSGTAAGKFTAGTAASGGTRQDAIILVNGDVDMHLVTAPTSTTSVPAARITPVSFAKAWASVSLTNATPFVPSVASGAGVNVSSVSRASSTALQVDWGTDFAGTNYAAFCTADISTWCRISSRAAGSMQVQLCNASSCPLTLDSVGATPKIDVVAFGPQ